MITFKTQINNLDWEKLVDLYDETDMCIGLGRKRETEKIRRAFNAAAGSVTWQYFPPIENKASGE